MYDFTVSTNPLGKNGGTGKFSGVCLVLLRRSLGRRPRVFVWLCIYVHILYVYCYISRPRERQVFLVMWGVSSPVKTLPGAPCVQPLNFSSSRLAPRRCVCTFMHIHLKCISHKITIYKNYTYLRKSQWRISYNFARLSDCKVNHEQQNHFWWCWCWLDADAASDYPPVCWSICLLFCMSIVGTFVDTEGLQQQKQHLCWCWLDADAVSALVIFEGNLSQQHHLCCLMLMLLRPWPPRRSAAAGKIQSGILLLIWLCCVPTRHLNTNGYLPQACYL